jgi:hypothetical protein
MSTFAFQSRKYDSVGLAGETEVVDRVPPLYRANRSRTAVPPVGANRSSTSS